MSGASVYRVHQDRQPLRYLKIARNDAAAALRDEIARTQWLAARGVCVPNIQQIDDWGDRVALLSSALPGAPADASPLPVPRLVDALATGLAALHAIPSTDCPYDESQRKRLARAVVAVAADEIDPDEFADRNSGIAPGTLLTRLMKTQPDEDLVIVHGDATLSNIVVDEDGDIGFVDCGNAGRGDRYLDLAVLANDIRETFGPVAAAHFASTYGPQRWDRAKAAYYLDLYELF